MNLIFVVVVVSVSPSAIKKCTQADIYTDTDTFHFEYGKLKYAALKIANVYFHVIRLLLLLLLFFIFGVFALNGASVEAPQLRVAALLPIPPPAQVIS